MSRPSSHATLVVGFDGSKRGRDALSLGRLIASGFDAALVVAVVHPFDRLMPHRKLGPTPPYDFETYAREQAHRIAAVGRALVPDHERFDIRVVGATSPARALYELADELEAVAVVVGSSHRGHVGRISPGSVAEALLSGSPCPVAIAPAGFAERAAHTLARVGVAYDESDEATRALAAAEGLAARLHAKLTVVAVAGSSEQREALQARMERIVNEAPAILAARADVRSGEAWEELREAGRELDLLVCGSRSYGPVRRVLLGSVTARLIRDAECPVLVIPRGAGGALTADASRVRGAGEQVSP